MSLTKSFPLLCALFLTNACVQDGTTPECGGGGTAALAAEGCATPIGGSCLSESEFKKGRPSEREVDGETVTVAEDWESYQEARPECDFD